MAGSATLGALVRGAVEGLRRLDGRPAASDEERGWIVAMAICDELHPLGPVQVPSRAAAGAALVREERDRQIRERFNGTNYDDLAARYRITSRQVRRIVERERRRRRDSDDVRAATHSILQAARRAR